MTAEEQLDGILDVLVALARRDFSQRAPVVGSDTIDALAAGINMLAEELDGEIASRAELEATQAKLVHAERMATIGLLASGVAHEVNNPAAWVTLSLGLLGRAVTDLRRVAEHDENDHVALRETLAKMELLLRDASEGMARITTVVQDLRTLTRADDRSFEQISFRDVFAGACRLAAPMLGGVDVDVVVDVDDAASVVANRGRVAQVVTNLLVNAAHAVRGVDGATIVLSARAVGGEGGGVVLAVEDNGPGIPLQIRETVFDPFFTTKAPAEGTGLGLTIVGQIATKVGGWARAVDPRGARGARVEVYFPRVARDQVRSA